MKVESFYFTFGQKDEPHMSVIESVCGLESAGEIAETNAKTGLKQKIHPESGYTASISISYMNVNINVKRGQEHLR